MKPRFLTVDEVLVIHQDQIARYGGEPTVRDQGLLESAVAMPAASFGDQYLHAFPHEMAAAYLFHIVANHPFIDGNKRTGLATALVFLKLNEVEYDLSDKQALEQMVLDVATGKAEKADVTLFFRQRIRSEELT